MEIVSEVEVFKALKKIGPSIPLDVKRELNKGDSIVVGAALSELVKQKKAKVTIVKKGGSPYYFTEGQDIEPLHVYLGEKDKRTFLILRDKKVLRDSKQDPLTRVSLRNIPDFSKKLLINVNGEKEIFWRYYKITDSQAVEILKNSMKKSAPAVKENESVANTAQVETKRGQEVQTNYNQNLVSKTSAVVVGKDENKHAKPDALAMQNTQLKNNASSVQESQKTLQNNEDVKKETHKLSDFEKLLLNYFDEHRILVISSSELRANSEYEFVLKITTPLGMAEFYCKARKKKKCNELDLSDALLQSNINRLPGIFLVKGELTKKAKEKLSSDFKGLIVKEI